MKRRDFLQATVAVGVSGVLSGAAPPHTEGLAAEGPVGEAGLDLGGMTLEELRNDYRRRLFEQYLPFWEKGGYDQRFGGFMCELNDDGSVSSDEKLLAYQGRAIWVYAFLYNSFGKNPRWLDIAARTREFMGKYMYAGEGQWSEKVHRDGTVAERTGTNVYGWLFAAAGLTQYYIATGDSQDLELAKESIAAAVKAYDDPTYADTQTMQYMAVELPVAGLRSQGHSMVLLWTLSQLLSVHEDSGLKELLQSHVDLLVNRFWNADYGIVNEYLAHDYSRLPEAESHMYAGHSMETLWMLLHEALRVKDRALFESTATRIRRLLEMCWDYVFDGWASGVFFVFEASKHRQGPDYSVKTMWAHCEILIACLTVLEYTGQLWAKEWYERTRTFLLKTMPIAEHGVWRQAVDRQGKDLKRVGISTKRKDNFHQARMLMLNLLSLDRMIGNPGKVTPFPH